MSTLCILEFVGSCQEIYCGFVIICSEVSSLLYNVLLSKHSQIPFCETCTLTHVVDVVSVTILFLFKRVE